MILLSLIFKENLLQVKQEFNAMNVKEFLYFYCMNEEEFERLFILEAIRLGEETYGSARAYGVAMWPEREKRVAGQTMYNLRNTTKTGKPQSIRLHEAVRMIELLNRGFASFCFEISEKIRLQNENAQIAPPSKNVDPESQGIVPHRPTPSAVIKQPGSNSG